MGPLSASSLAESSSSGSSENSTSSSSSSSSSSPSATPAPSASTAPLIRSATRRASNARRPANAAPSPAIAAAVMRGAPLVVVVASRRRASPPARRRRRRRRRGGARIVGSLVAEEELVVLRVALGSAIARVAVLRVAVLLARPQPARLVHAHGGGAPRVGREVAPATKSRVKSALGGFQAVRPVPRCVGVDDGDFRVVAFAVDGAERRDTAGAWFCGNSRVRSRPGARYEATQLRAAFRSSASLPVRARASLAQRVPLAAPSQTSEHHLVAARVEARAAAVGEGVEDAHRVRQPDVPQGVSPQHEQLPVSRVDGCGRAKASPPADERDEACAKAEPFSSRRRETSRRRRRCRTAAAPARPAARGTRIGNARRTPRSTRPRTPPQGPRTRTRELADTSHRARAPSEEESANGGGRAREGRARMPPERSASTRSKDVALAREREAARSIGRARERRVAVSRRRSGSPGERRARERVARRAEAAHGRNAGPNTQCRSRASSRRVAARADARLYASRRRRRTTAPVHAPAKTFAGATSGWRRSRRAAREAPATGRRGPQRRCVTGTRSSRRAMGCARRV